MGSFYQKLASKLNEGVGSAVSSASTAVKTVTFKATGERADAAHAPADPKAAAPAAAPGGGEHAAEPLPEGTEPLDIDLFQSESRAVILAPLPGVTKENLDLTIDEEENTVTIQAVQKRPPLPPVEAETEEERKKKEQDETEKGRYAKQEVKWKTFYRKVYAPMPFDSGDTKALLDRGVLIIVLPSKKPGAGKKLSVKEILDETRPPQPGK